MRVHLRALLLATAACAAVLVVGRPAAAQSDTQTSSQDHGAIRLGAYFPTNSKFKAQVGNTVACGGLDVVIDHSGASVRDILSVDYIERQDNGRRLQVLPVTLGQQWYQVGKDLKQSNLYFGWGIGAYFADTNVIDDQGVAQDRNQTLFGGYLNAGVEVYQGIFLDARYHMASTSGPANIGGLELTGGYRF